MSETIVKCNELGDALITHLTGKGKLWLNVYHCQATPVAKRSVLDGFPPPGFVCPVCGQQAGREELIYDFALET